MELFPFSYAEFLAFRGLDRDPASLMEYLQTGGVPEYVKHGIPQILQSLADDILVRDIAVRHAVRDVNTLRQLTAFLITNIGNLMSASKLVGMFDIKSPATFLEYFSFLKGAYLLDFLPMFSHSLKVQARNPKKVYVMDMGLYTQLAISTTENMGRRLENLVFLHLRRSHQQLFYHKDRGECDFLVLERGVVRHAIQVCAMLTDENFEREFQGLWDAMSHFDLQQGTIVTLEQTDSFVRDGRHVEVVPAHIFMD